MYITIKKTITKSKLIYYLVVALGRSLIRERVGDLQEQQSSGNESDGVGLNNSQFKESSINYM